MVLMKSAKDKKSIKKGYDSTYNADLIFSRVLSIGTNQNDFKTLFNFQLVVVPPLLFEESGTVR